MAPIEVVRRGGREGAAHAIWRRVLVQPTSLGGHGPALVDGFLCPPCSGARVHQPAAEADRVRSFLDQHDQITLPGWAALGTARPNPEPWAHVAVPPPPEDAP